MKKVALAGTFSVLSLAPLASWALGLGRLNVQSALGEPLRADIEVTSITPEETASLQARVASPETYRAAGVDYNQVLAATSITLQRGPDGRAYLRLTSDRAVTEPFVDAILDLAWSSGRLVREYTLLFDPPSSNRMAAAPITPLAMDTPPAPRSAPAPSRPPAPAVAAAPAPAPSTAQPPAPARPPASQAAARPVPPPEAPAPRLAQSAAPESDEPESRSVKVRSGDTLSAIAERNLQQGVALDQMIVGLYRANPRAFQGNNMNRLKSGVVLNVPGSNQAGAVSPSEARQIIVAQSADFAAYRERLAGSVTESVGSTQQRQASGKIEAEVQDRQRAAAPTPDKLTLSKGGMSSGTASSPEDRLAKSRADQESSTRVAELSRNLDELRKLKEKAPVVAAKPAPAPAPVAPPPPPPPAPVPPPPAPAVPAPVPAPAAAPVASAAVAPASVPDQAASIPDVSASGAATGVADAASEAPVEAPAPIVPTVPKPVQIPVPAAEPEAPGFFESVDPMLLLGAGAGIVLLAAGALYVRSRRRPDGAETSFLESRLQPDSFFGASGGQRVDTRDASGGPSSMSYSLSQLDAIGDVDPVAEADVYLAYGRDLQAEEILKEALRGNPDRLAIRTKLLEVYAKRRDTKGFEQLAGQLFAMTGGQGEDWLRAQEMGLSIDPENPLYQPGGQPAVATMSEPQYREPLGASTVPLSEMPPLDTMPVAPEPAVDDLGLDLDISAPAPLASEPPSAVRPTAPVFSSALDLPPLTQAPAPAPALNDDLSLDFDLPLESPAATPPAAPAPSPAAASPAPGSAMEFDLSGINLDLSDPEVPEAGGEVINADDMPPLDSTTDDPLARKLELAEEFRHIGDVDGARELLQEVVASAEGATRAKAQAMLDDLT